MFARADAVWFVDGVLFLGRGTLLPPREGRLLSYLAVHMGEVCQPELLCDAIWGEPERWPETSEHDLHAFIATLRKTLPRRLAFIETITRKNGKGHALVGYRLTGSIGVRKVAE